MIRSMPQLSIYVDEELGARLAEEARSRGLSQSALAREALAKHLPPQPRRPFPPEWYANLGTWEDDRTTEEIIAEIKRDQFPTRRAGEPLPASRD